MAAEYIRPDSPELASMTLADVAKALAEKRLPPVDQWNPAMCGTSDMVIRKDGSWIHMGTPIGRQAMVNLFSTILRREADGSYVLVTPVEKLTIAVEDAPFVAVEVSTHGEGPERNLVFRTNTDEMVMANADHPIRVETDLHGNPRPYVRVRGPADRPLDALINRAVFYELIDFALGEQEGGPLGLWSGGQYFAFAN